MGRPPTPTSKLKIAGTFREDRHAGRLDASELGLSAEFDCPDHLSEIAKREWNRIIGSLRPLGLATTIDRAVLATYCASWSRWVECEVLLADEGLIVEGHRGVMNVNPLTRLSRDSRDAMISSAKELGMTPSSRSSLQMDPSKREVDPLDALLARRDA